jgi:hypothetical protein
MVHIFCKICANFFPQGTVRELQGIQHEEVYAYETFGVSRRTFRRMFLR